MKHASRYHPLLVILHWLIALLILAALGLGVFGLALTPDADPGKIDRLEIHMAGGMLILALMAVRFLVRLATARPGPILTGRPALDRLAPLTHYGFYILVPLMVGTGYTTGILAGLPAIVFQRSGAPLPADLLLYPTQLAHGVFGALLTALIGLHLAAALHHRLTLKDGLFRRMTLGQRVVDGQSVSRPT